MYYRFRISDGLKIQDACVGSSLAYCAPEILLYTPKFSFPVDIWSLGCIFGEMLRPKCQKMFSGNTNARQYGDICHVMGKKDLL